MVTKRDVTVSGSRRVNQPYSLRLLMLRVPPV